MQEVCLLLVTLAQPTVISIRPVLARRVMLSVMLTRGSVPICSVAATIADLNVVALVRFHPAQDVVARVRRIVGGTERFVVYLVEV